MDKWVDLVPQAGSGADATAEWSGDQKVITKYLKNLNLPIEYDANATSGAVATIRSNNIGLIVCGSNATNLSAVKLNVRVRFTDL